jgi:hypothetical protein
MVKNLLKSVFSPSFSYPRIRDPEASVPVKVPVKKARETNKNSEGS